MAEAFYSFLCLPAELRHHIWSLAFVLRIVHINAVPKHQNKTLNVASYHPLRHDPSAAPPAVMHACHESRQHAPYRKAFFTPSPDDDDDDEDPERQYVWVNFEWDMICIPDSNMARLAPHDGEIQRLRITMTKIVDFYNENTFYDDWKMMASLTGLRELHVAVEEDFFIYGVIVETLYGSCPPKNVRYLDLQTGLLLTGPELELAYSWEWQRGGLVRHGEDFEAQRHRMLPHCKEPNLDLPGWPEYVFRHS